MEKEQLPKYPYGSKVYIKKGFYRGYKAEVKSYEKISLKNTETNEEENYILYNVKIDNVNIKEYSVKEDWLIAYKKYIIF